MLRLLHADKVAEMRDKLTSEEFGIMNRSWELFKPLLVVARALGLPHDDLVSFIKDWERRRRKEEMSEEDVKLLNALIELAKDKPDDEILAFTNAELLDAMLPSDASDDERKRTAQRIGFITRNFGFEKDTDSKNRRATYKIAKKEIKDLWESYGRGRPDKSGALKGSEGLMGAVGGGDALPQVTLNGVQKGSPAPTHQSFEAPQSGGLPESLDVVLTALEPFRGGGTIAKAKLAEITGIPDAELKKYLDELATRGAIIDRGAFVGVL